MRVLRLELADFRNYPTLALEPGAGLNILVGPNAQGKTNVLESLHVLATTKSHRTHRDAEMVRFGAAAARVLARVERETGDPDSLIELAIAPPGAPGVGGERKRVRINQARQPRVTDLLGRLNAVLFASTDLDIVRGEPDERRRFLNYEISQISPRYALALASYRRALEQRNRLLKEIRHGNAGAESLDAWSEALVEHGARLFERRRDYCARLAEHAARVHTELADGVETLVLTYVPSLPLPPDASLAALGDAFREALRAARRDELARGSTLIGPQRDDLVFKVGADPESAVDARIYGSQGQQRTVALALRLAERQLIEETVGEAPLVLLDDVLSDLDERRRAQIFALALSGGQTFLTTTDLGALPASAVDAAHVFPVRAGRIATAGGV